MGGASSKATDVETGPQDQSTLNLRPRDDLQLPEAAPFDDWGFAPGSTVKIHSLMSQPHYNGSVAELESYDADKGRWQLKISALGPQIPTSAVDASGIYCMYNDVILSLKPENLQLAQLASEQSNSEPGNPPKMEVATEGRAEPHIQCDLVQVEVNPGEQLGWTEGMPKKDEEDDEDDETGESLDKPVFAYRGDGKDSCVEFKSGHAKFLSALNVHLLPDLGSSHRAQQAAEAYKEFLHGLQLIGAQETINQHGSYSKNVLELYNWERQIQARANCRTTYLFDHNLRERVQLPMSLKPGECSFDKVPIRAATRAYLTRPVEKDFTLVGVLMYMTTCIVYGVSLYTQCTQIAQICSTPFICPAGSITSGLPITAPPVLLRNLTTDPNVRVTNVSMRASKSVWLPTAEFACSFGAGCDSPGYEVQWPYVQGLQNTEEECDTFGTYDECNSTSISEQHACSAVASKCVFPFTYDGLTFKECTTYKSTDLSPWCSLSADYDDPVSGGRWGHCNPCRGENLPLAPELLQEGKCSVKREGADGWVWDPFLSKLRNEYLDCSIATDCVETVCASEDDGPKNIPFVQENQVQGESVYSPMHFATDFYQLLHTITIECMERTQEKLTGQVIKDLGGSTDADRPDDVPIMAHHSEWSSLNGVQSTAASRLLRECIAEKQAYKQSDFDKVNRCACDNIKFSNWPIHVYYTERGLPTHRCYGGRDSNSLCDPKANTCRDFASCERTFDKQHPIAISARYGCFFAHPSATTPISARYTSCGTAPSTVLQSQRVMHTDAEKREYEKSVAVYKVGTSRRFFLLAVFLLKELNYITAGIFLTITTLLLLPLLILVGVPSYAFFRLYLIRTKHRHARFVFWVVGIKNFLLYHIGVIVVMCINFSTIYRISKLVQAIGLKQVNKSIKDMDRKMTSLANTVYGLVLLFASGTSPDLSLMVSLTATLVLLLRQMNEEKVLLEQIARPLKDFNENRLSTFETALLWIKVLEDFLDDDVQFNWIQIFRAREPLRPTFSESDELIGSEISDLNTLCPSRPADFSDWVTEALQQHWEDKHHVIQWAMVGKTKPYTTKGRELTDKRLAEALTTPGLKWKNVGSQPQTGTEIHNTELAKKLLGKTDTFVEFSRHELHDLKLVELSYDSYIQVVGGHSSPLYFQPVVPSETQFTQKEWEESDFGIDNLRFDDYIKSGDVYFTPAARDARDLLYLEPLQRNLRKTFGHDKKGFSQNLTQIPQTVENHTGNHTLVRFTEEASGMLKAWANAKKGQDRVEREQAIERLQLSWGTADEAEDAERSLETESPEPQDDPRDTAAYWARVRAEEEEAEAAAAEAAAIAAAEEEKAQAAATKAAMAAAKAAAEAAAEEDAETAAFFRREENKEVFSC